MPDKFDTGEEIFDDQSIDHLTYNSGHIPRDYGRHPYGSLEGSADFPANLLLSKSEQVAALQELKAAGGRMSDIKKRQGIKASHQGNTSQCHNHAVVNAMRLIRAVNNQPYVDLSASSVGSRMSNFQDVGGWSGEDLAWIIKYGVVPQSLWPENSFKRSLLTPEAEKEALKYRVSEFWDLRSWDELISALATPGVCCFGGWNRLGHAMSVIDAEVIDGDPAIRVWDSYGDDSRDEPGGTYLMRGRSAIPDDMGAIRVVSAKG